LRQLTHAGPDRVNARMPADGSRGAFPPARGDFAHRANPPHRGMNDAASTTSSNRNSNMKVQPSKLLRLAALGAAGLSLVQATHAATVLTGIVNDTIANTGDETNDNLPANHGSNAVGTPNLALTWSPTGSFNTTTANGWQIYHTWPNAGTGGDAYQLDRAGNPYNGALTYSVAFTPSSATIAVVLTSIDLNDWSGGSPAGTTLNWSVVGSVSGLLGSGTGVVVTDAVQSLGLGFQGIGGEIVTLNLIPTAGAGSYFAVDNLSFDQVTVPEPSGAILAATGLGALALRRRRK
jgi:MYXO-CTERM domain-containing protein